MHEVGLSDDHRGETSIGEAVFSNCGNQVCVNETCVPRNHTEGDGWVVFIEMDNVSVSEVTINQIIVEITNLTKLSAEDLVIETEIDSNGYITLVAVNVADEKKRLKAFQMQ